MSADATPLDPKDTFEGEETLGAEFLEHSLESGSDAAGSHQTDVYLDATVHIAPESASAFQLKRKLDKTPPLIRLDPDFQRQDVWSLKQKSELIESVLMGIPLPLIYMKEDDKGVYIVVDGRHRLSAFFDFMNNKFPLQKLSVLKELNGACFSEASTGRAGAGQCLCLTQAQQSKVEDCPLTLHVIKPPTEDRVTFDLFDRVNRGGTRLNNQEMRNAIYQGAATDLLNDLAGFESFKEATEDSIQPSRMKDKYLILRLIAFYLWRKKKWLSVKETGAPPVEYRGDLEDFLGKTMIFLNHEAGRAFCDQFPKMFDETMNACRAILGAGCFRWPKKEGQKNRRPISMTLFETAAYLIVELMDLPREKYGSIKNGFKALVSDKKFIRSATYIVDSKLSVNHRFKLVEKTIEEIRHA